MKRISVSFLWIALFLVTIPPPAFTQEFVEGDLIVQLNVGVEIESFVLKYDGIGLRAEEELWSELRIWLLAFDVGRSKPEEALAALLRDEEVSFAQFNHYVTERATVPNDPRFSEQWALHNTGQTGGTPDADIDAPEAWDITTGGTTALGDQIVVAVIDGGFDLNHTDLSFMAADMFSIWFVPGRRYYAVGAGIHQKRTLGDSAWSAYPPGIVTRFFSGGIRGQDINDLFVVGAFGEVVHFNGQSWFRYFSDVPLPSGYLGYVATKNNLMMATGQVNASRGVVLIGRR